MGGSVSRSLNKVTLIGNLGADPEVRTTAGGTRVATLSVATSRSWTNQSGERQEKTEWHRAVLWRQLADIAERYLTKGDKVYLEGRIEYRSWEDRDGNTRYTTEISVQDMIMLSPRGGGGGDDTGRSAPSRPAKAAASESAAESYNDFPEALDEEEDDLPF
jgi:single-strand DNA-binding protein